ncbi:galactosyl transferase GMA12/MNN10 family-domain-containing protein [Lipomyces kononenkoae]
MRFRKLKTLAVLALVTIVLVIYFSAPSKVDGTLWVKGDLHSGIKEQVPIGGDLKPASETVVAVSGAESVTELPTETAHDVTAETIAQAAKETGTDESSASKTSYSVAEPSIENVVDVSQQEQQPRETSGPEHKQQQTTDGETETDNIVDPEIAKAHAEERRSWLAEIQNKSPDTLEPKGNKIVLLTASDGKGHNGAISNLLQMVNENREDYCAFHGYTHQFLNISTFHTGDRPAVWSKIPAIQETFRLHPDAEWVWWLDTDAIIMTPSIDLAGHVLHPEAMKKQIEYDTPFKLPSGKDSGFRVSRDMDLSQVDIVVSQDHNGVNAGSILFRRSEWSFAFLDMWIDPMYVNSGFERFEQDALNHIILNHAKIRSRVAVVHQRAINAFSVGDDDQKMGWMTGDLVVHFAGCWVQNECDLRWKDFWSRRQVIKVPATPEPKSESTESTTKEANAESATSDKETGTASSQGEPTVEESKETEKTPVEGESQEPGAGSAEDGDETRDVPAETKDEQGSHEGEGEAQESQAESHQHPEAGQAEKAQPGVEAQPEAGQPEDLQLEGVPEHTDDGSTASENGPTEQAPSTDAEKPADESAENKDRAEDAPLPPVDYSGQQTNEQPVDHASEEAVDGQGPEPKVEEQHVVENNGQQQVLGEQEGAEKTDQPAEGQPESEQVAEKTTEQDAEQAVEQQPGEETQTEQPTAEGAGEQQANEPKPAADEQLDPTASHEHAIDDSQTGDHARDPDPEH